MSIHFDPLRLHGPWAEGFVLERQHTLASRHIGDDSFGHPQFETTRSELGELLNRLKYREDRTALAPIAEAAAEFIGSWGIEFDCLVPMPASRSRTFQPVTEITFSVGALRGRPVLGALIKARETPELKDVFAAEQRLRLLEGAIIASADVQNRHVLLLDDLYRSGATAAVATNALLARGAARVYFLAMTKTRVRS